MQALSNYINQWRTVHFGGTVMSPNAIMVGVAQWHAEDMANNDYVGIIGSDGEDPFVRVTCSGGPKNVGEGVIAIGYSTDPFQVFQAVISDLGCQAVIDPTFSFTTMSIGYYEGYWMILCSN